MWITIDIDPGDERLDTSGTTARRFSDQVDDMYDRPPTVEWHYNVDVKCHTFDGCPVVEYDEEALAEHFEAKLREADYDG
jgi:hypothetical protein